MLISRGVGLRRTGDWTREDMATERSARPHGPLQSPERSEAVSLYFHVCRRLQPATNTTGAIARQ